VQVRGAWSELVRPKVRVISLGFAGRVNHQTMLLALIGGAAGVFAAGGVPIHAPCRMAKFLSRVFLAQGHKGCTPRTWLQRKSEAPREIEFHS